MCPCGSFPWMSIGNSDPLYLLPNSFDLLTACPLVLGSPSPRSTERNHHTTRYSWWYTPLRTFIKRPSSNTRYTRLLARRAMSVKIALRIIERGTEYSNYEGRWAVAATDQDPAEYAAYMKVVQMSTSVEKAQAADEFLRQHPNTVVKAELLKTLLNISASQLGSLPDYSVSTLAVIQGLIQKLSIGNSQELSTSDRKFRYKLNHRFRGRGLFWLLRSLRDGKQAPQVTTELKWRTCRSRFADDALALRFC